MVENGRLIVWNLSTGQQRLVAQSGGRFSALAVAPAQARLAATCNGSFDSGDRIFGLDTVRYVT